MDMLGGQGQQSANNGFGGDDGFSDFQQPKNDGFSDFQQSNSNPGA